MKLLLVGNHTCGNRGDAAILRGLISELRAQYSGIELDIYSRFPTSSSYLLDEELIKDPLDEYHNRAAKFPKTIIKSFKHRLLGYELAKKLGKNVAHKNLPEHIVKEIDFLKKYDAIIQVGGSFFVDLYGAAQFEHALCALLAGKKMFMLGHSVGPFESTKYAALASKIFAQVDELALRETLSEQYMVSAKVNTSRVSKGADTAWVVPNKVVTLPNHLTATFNDRPVIAITLRNLAPFDQRLGVTQQDYEQEFASLINKLNDQGYKVILCSTCTGIEGYHRDDRMVALQVQRLVNSKENCYVVMDELNDIELGSLLSMCELTIGTRLHSAIISMNFGTPAIAINYEHKSKGIMAQLGMPELSQDIDSLFNDELFTAVRRILSDLANVTARMKVQVEQERKLCSSMVKRVIQSIESK